MEAIVLIIGEIVFAVLAPFFLLIANLIGSVFSLIASFLLGSSYINTQTKEKQQTGTETTRDSVTASSTGKPQTLRFARLGAMVLTGLAVLTLAGIGIVNTFFFNDSVRYVFNKVQDRSGITTSCENIDGSVFAGKIDLRNCTIQRPSHSESSFDLRLAKISLDLKITSLFGTAQLESAELDGLDGWVKKTQKAANDSDSSEDVDKPRRAFVIDRLDVTNVDLNVSGVNPDGNPFSLPISIEHIHSQPLRSRMALFDVLFRSNVSGSISDSPFDIVTSKIASGRKTEWRAPNIPVASLGAMAGGPLSWFSEGTVEVFVVDEWEIDNSLTIDMDWRLKFSNIEVKAPQGTSKFKRIASAPLTRYVNGHNGDFPLEFSLVLNESQFESKSSLAAAGLWSAVGESIKFILTSFNIQVDKEADVGGGLKKGAISILDKLRKPKEDESD
ncbi:MAG: hypothetical protein AB8G18_05920 [Gammaproteobacteria bacterium]